MTICIYKENMSVETLVSRWNDFDPLEEVVVGLPTDACSISMEPSRQYPNFEKYMNGKKSSKSIKAAKTELEGLKTFLEGEGIVVLHPDDSLCQFNVNVKTPDFEAPYQHGVTCPRDILLTVGNEILEAPMCNRYRFFE